MTKLPPLAAPGFKKFNPDSRSIPWIFYVLLSLSVFITARSSGAAEASYGGLRLLEAVKTTIRNQPDIQLKEQDVDISRGSLKTESGAFDTNITASAQYDHNTLPLGSIYQLYEIGLDEITDTATASAGVSKQFRNGISITPNVSLSRTDVEPPALSTSIRGPSNTATIDFQITIPLLKGLGVDATGANERSAKINLEVSVLTMRQAIAADVLNTAQAYWDCVAAVMTVKQREESEARAVRISEDIKALIAGGEKPAAEMEQVSANLAARIAARMAADQQLVDAKHSLGLAMGLSSDGIQSMGLPIDDYPELSEKHIEYITRIGARIGELALERRADYLGSKKSEEAAKVLVVAARKGLRPQLDLTVGAGYNGLDEGNAYELYVTSLKENVRGYNASFSISYKWPVENNAAKGALLQKEAAYRKALINTKDLARNIGSNVSQAIAALKNKASEVAKDKEAVEHYRQAVENEILKNRLGTSTTLDLLTTEEHLTNAVLNQISAQTAFAKALAKLRYESGTLLVERKEGISVGADELTTIPRP